MNKVKANLLYLKKKTKPNTISIKFSQEKIGPILVFFLLKFV